MKLLVIILAALFAALQFKLWLGSEGLPEYWGLKQDIVSQTGVNDKDLQRNRALTADVRDLKDGLESVEERARSEMGMIKQGETFYQVIDPPPQGD